MRPVIAVFLVALAHTAFGASVGKAEVTPFVFENEIYEIVDCVRNFLGEHYQVVEVDELHLDFDSIQIGDVRGHLSLRNLVLTDPSLLSVSGLVGTITILPPAFILQGRANAYDLLVRTEYEGEMTENELHMWGNGDLEVHVLDVVIDNIFARYGLLANPPFTDLSGSLSVGPSTGSITGYIDEAETQRVTEIINDLTSWVSENSARINGIIGKYLQAVLNGEFIPSEDPEPGDEPSFWDQLQEYCPILGESVRI